jgi:hypothetical protein
MGSNEVRGPYALRCDVSDYTEKVHEECTAQMRTRADTAPRLRNGTLEEDGGEHNVALKASLCHKIASSSYPNSVRLLYNILQ